MDTLTTPTTDAETGVDAAATVRAALDDVMDALEVLNAAATHVQDLDLTQSVSILKDLRRVVVELRLIDDAYLTRRVSELLRYVNGPVEVEGVAAVEIARSKNRRAWQHDALIRDWLDAHMIATGGEVCDPADLLTAFRKAAQISGWKVTAMREMGLDVDDYCDSSPGVAQVRFL